MAEIGSTYYTTQNNRGPLYLNYFYLKIKTKTIH